MSLNPANSLWKLAVAAGLAVLVFGCGGGGGGGGNSGSGGGGSISYPVTNLSMLEVFSGTQAPVDLTNTAAGNSIQFEFTATDANNRLVIVKADSLQTNAPSSVATTSNGVLKIKASSSGTSYSVTASYLSPKSPDGTLPSTFTVNFTSIAAEGSVSGAARDINGTVLPGLTIDFFSSSQKLIGTAVTGLDGSFQANVPMTAKTFAPDLSSLSDTYTSVYAYGDGTYSMTVNTPTNHCVPALPALKSGSNVPLANAVVLYPLDVNNPPPAPTCGLG
ncbi:MAG TPA: hypothetical protein VG944_23120 [Fimbriimonas sp.]|nr:hypothetical protein [Fimbriimonas sp.]